uniref:DNA mismatch repair ATPase n=1 Tax=Pithovirus LCPAC404 TaxID=2506597 RepID=A0A481ZCF8_9VIRU|nr:MAG: DNA mismatch repair ATPase [Pithovirus LCPAC404]
MDNEKPSINKRNKISEQYQSVYDFYHKRLGDNVAVLLQCGDFFEVYSYGITEDDQPNNAIKLADVMGIYIGYLPRSSVTHGNPWKGGFNKRSLSKFRNKLLTANYSVIVCEELPSDTSPKQREVTSIQTPGVSTNVDGYRENYVMCIYIEHQNPKIKPIRLDTLELVIGAACIDVSTGKSQVFEIVSTYETIQSGELNAIEEIYRFLHSHHCRELVIHLTGFDVSKKETEQKVRRYFKEILGLKDFYVHEFTINELNKDWTTARYINKVLALIYADDIGTVGISPLEFFNIKYILNGATAFITLIEYIRVRDEKLIYKLEHIQIWSCDEHLILTHNCQRQLDLVPRPRKVASEQVSLFDIVNNTSTAMGSRLLESTILRPFQELRILELKYAQLSTMINFGNEFPINIGKWLREMVDLQRYHRKVDVGLLSPCNLLRLIQSYEAISHVIFLIQKANKHFTSERRKCDATEDESLPLPDVQTLEKFEEFRKTLNIIFNQDALLECKSSKLITLNVFNPGIDPKVDQLELSCGDVDQLTKQLATRFAYLMSPDIAKDKIFKLIKPENPVKSGRYFGVHHKVWGAILVYKRLIAEAKDMNKVTKYFSIEDLYKAHNHEITDVQFRKWGQKMMTKSSCEFEEPLEYLSIDDVHFVRSLNATRLKSKVKVYCDSITQSEISDQVQLDTFHKLVTASFHEVCQNIYSLNSIMLKTMTQWVANIDLIKSNAITAQVNRYSRPCTVKNSTNNSFIRAEKIRHPIIERIQDDIPYVPNDVKIGTSETNHASCGMFLFGTNNGGKSSYLKAVGLNVVLAQCGMYVAADTFRYAPFGNIITRLSGEDNMYRRQGTYAVEVSELTTVMSQSNENTLVLGDEICHGTEFQSAYGIVSASVIRLCSKYVNFIFSTHLHAVTNNLDVLALTEGNNPSLRYNHFTTILDEKTQEVIFEYKLHPGLGENLYGIEIAEMMGLDKETCILAYKYRNQLIHAKTYDIPLGGQQHSLYNIRLINGICEIEKCKQPVKDTHHIMHQSESDENGYIDTFHKNSLFNLVGLCKKHHQQQHHGNLRITGKAMTTRGIILLFEEQ